MSCERCWPRDFMASCTVDMPLHGSMAPSGRETVALSGANQAARKSAWAFQGAAVSPLWSRAGSGSAERAKARKAVWPAA